LAVAFTVELSITGANCGLPTVGAVRVVGEPKPGLPTDPNDPRAFNDVFTDISPLFVINNERLVRRVDDPRRHCPQRRAASQRRARPPSEGACAPNRRSGSSRSFRTKNFESVSPVCAGIGIPNLGVV
jgi:hypothetical protein